MSVNAALWRGEGPAPADTDVRAYRGLWQWAGTGADGRARLVVPVGEVLVTTHLWNMESHTDSRVAQVVRAVRGLPASATLRIP